MTKPTVPADFNNADPQGRLRVTVAGSVQDLARQGVRLRDGPPLTVRDEELEADGEAQFSPEEGGWVARIDRDKVRPRSA